jgi:hypothetical protein
MKAPKKLKMTFQIQKNRQNGQSITLVADDATKYAQFEPLIASS